MSVTVLNLNAKLAEFCDNDTIEACDVPLKRKTLAKLKTKAKRLKVWFSSLKKDEHRLMDLVIVVVEKVQSFFLATKISFINTIANICEKISGADITIVAKSIGLDQRINPQFLRAGLGYDGSCFPKDVKALIAFSIQLGYIPAILQAVQEVNENQAKHTVEKAKEKLKELNGKRIAILGLSFKPNTDDMREARSIPIITQLLKEGAKTIAYDPAAISNTKSLLKEKIRYASSSIDCLKAADCCIIVTEWGEFKKLVPEDFT